VDEAQDISISQLRFAGSLGAGRADALFFAGDLGQRIFQQPFSWKAAGVDIRGRSTMLKINYRTSHQIRSQSDRLLDAEIADETWKAVKARLGDSLVAAEEKRENEVKRLTERALAILQSTREDDVRALLELSLNCAERLRRPAT
jgi:hypothetical protein